MSPRKSLLIVAPSCAALVCLVVALLRPEPTAPPAPVSTPPPPAVAPPRVSRSESPAPTASGAALPPVERVRQLATAVRGEASAAFYGWATTYLAADEAERPRLAAEGRRLAEARRAEFRKVIVEDPRRALEEAVPMVVRQQLPEQIVQRLETRVNGVAAIRVMQGVPLPGDPRPAQSLTHRVAEFADGKTYRAYVYGERAAKVTWTAGASLNGVALETDFAVNEQPSRTLEVGEIPNPNKPAVTICPISGKTTALASTEAVSEQTPAVETATEIVSFCGAMHIDPFNHTLIMGEGVSGGAFGFTGILPSAPTPALGNVKVLAIPMTYADQNAVPSTEAALSATLRDVGDFYAKASFGRISLVGVVTPPVKLPHNEAWYVNRDTSNGGDIDGEGTEHAHAREEARKLGFDSNDYDCIVVRHNGGPGSYGGLGGGSSVWARSDGVSLWAHEIGHCFGLAHSNFWDTAGTSAIGAGTNQEYGDSYDIMGGGPYAAGHYNAQAKSQIKWLPANFNRAISQSGQYRLYAFDQGVLVPNRDYALTIVKDAQKTYWAEVRSLYDTNPWVKNGVLLGWRYPNGSGGNLQRIDVTPGSPFLKEDAPISLGLTFSDRESGIHITTVAVNDSPRYADVVVNFGQFPGNHDPVLTLAASADVVPTGATVTFTATASDPDGDALAYSWQNFGDTSVKVVPGNSAVITRTFTTQGTYIVSCTASDMKGGTTTRTKLITVGNGNGRFTISGRVTLLGQGLQDVVITANGANGVVTDADGYYTIPNLAANTYTMTPLLYGYTFGELFNNSVTVGPSSGGADFEATPTPVVTIAATVPNAGEAAPVTPGRFTITRTGDTSQALLVNVNTALGSAPKGTDYTFTPDYVAGSQGFSTFTVPAGSATLNVVVTPVVDTAAEGPETVILQLGPGNGYLVGTQSTATVVIDDDDTALPKVSIAATTSTTVENSGQPVVFTFTRSTTSGSLTVNYAVSGTAISGADFTALSGSVVIPNGATSAPVNVTPVNDSTSEPLETVILTTSTNAAYLIDPLATTATASIIDDDVQTVTVVAADPNAKEVDLSIPGAVADTGTFLITRSGDTSSALTVYYAMAGTPNSGVAALHGVDYEALPGSVVIPAGAASASVTIVPRYDTIGEGPETAVLTLAAGSTNYVPGTPNSATVTITDAATDVPYIDVVNISSAAEPGTPGTFRITVRGGTDTGTLAVNFALSGTATVGTDYTITGTGNTNTGTTITLNNGATVTKDVVVTPTNDTAIEELETITLTLTPSAAYSTFPSTSAATMWLRDDDQPTVDVDTQVGTGGSSTFTEGATTSPVKFYVSRTGSTTATLTVNYTIGGTATPDADYTALSGTVTIPAGSLGADVPVSVINDTIFEGTETITFDFAAGSYAHGPGAVMYIADNETSAQTVAFASGSAAGSEGVATVNVPVTLASPATAPVTVEYAVDSGTRSSSSATNNTQPLPYWVRMVKTGTSFASYCSNDGQTWVQLGTTQALASFTATSYLAGLCVCAGADGSLSTVVFDNVTITGLSGGGTVGATTTTADIGAVAAVGNSSESGGTYTVTGSGADIWNTVDEFRYTWFPVTSSANCTITARVVSQGNTAVWAKAGVMIRATNVAGSMQAMTVATPGNGRAFQYRGTLNGSSTAVTNTAALLRPLWVRLQRAGNVFTAAHSPDGATWVAVGTPKTLALSSDVLAGLAVSARNDNLVTTAIFDNVSLTGSPAFAGRTVGYVNTPGSDSVAGGIYTVTASGAQIGGGEDECHFVAAPVTGDFTLVGRVLTQSGGNANAQAGVMVRESGGFRVRSLYCGSVANAGAEFITRDSSISNAFGSGVDYTLGGGVLTFNVGEQTKNITLAVTDDSTVEPDDNLTIVLRNPSGATMGAISQFTYTIVDNDSAAALPFAGFAAATSTVSESAGNVSIPVSLSAPATGAMSVDYALNGGTATDGTDFTFSAGTLIFAPGETIKSIPLSITQDTIVESGETVIVKLLNPVGIQLGTLDTHTLTIADDDFPTVSIVATDPTAAESGDTGTFTITRQGALAGTLTVNFTRSGTAASGTDYAAIATPGSVTILDGQASATLTVSPLQDATNEGNETVILTLTATPASYTLGTPTTATVTIADDDRSTVTIVANDPDASETPGNPGQFTITRSAPTTASLTVNLSVSGTATSGTDYTTSPTTVSPITFAAGQSTRTIDILPINDSATEGPEDVTISIASGSYDIGAASYDNVTIADNDNPPTIFIASPSAQGPLIATGNGVIVSATVTDDGAPQPTTLVWTQAAGPGTATIESPTSATTAVTFSTPGTYVLRVTATDGQFTVSDQVTVVVGSSIVAADWITQDLGPSSSRRGQGLQTGSLFSVSGTGAGYASTASDQAHVMIRSVDGDTSIVARVTSLPTNGALGGITMRDSMMRAARRAVLGYVPGAVPALQFRTRTTVNTNDTVVTQAGVSLPIWLKLERNATTGEITASYAPDLSGSPDAWTQIGSPTVVTMDARADVGLTATNNSTAGTATATFDNVALTPSPVGPALLSEDSGNTPAAAGSASLAGSTYTISGSTSGYYHGWQFYGDMMVTVKHATATSGAGSATSGIRISENLESGGYSHVGRIPTGSYNGYYWRSIAGGSGGGVPSFTGATRWVRIIRQGNAITAFHAPDVSGNPGTWAQLGQPQTVIMTTPVFVGFWVDNNSGLGMNTVTFSNLSIIPLNTAPNVNIAQPANYALSPLALDGTVTDDNFPAPPAVTTTWSKRSGPGTATFANTAAIDTGVALSAAGSYVLRLQAADGSVATFRDLTVTGYLTAFDVWRGQQWAATGGLADPDSAPTADPDQDGLENFLEYSAGTSPTLPNASPTILDRVTVEADQFLRLSVTKNPSAAGFQFQVQANDNLTNSSGWSGSGLIIEEETPTSLRVRDYVPLGTAPGRFLRLMVREP
ncbi:MAG: Calx-beta domain-containing protein [Chthoniobacteraceae bacterium]